MGRKPECSKCGKLKEPGRDNESCCKKCKAEMRSAKAAAKRAQAGLPVWGSGRNPNCSICGKSIEERDHSFCRDCHNEREKTRYWQKHKDPIHAAKRREERKKLYQEDEFYRKKKIAQSQAIRAINDGTLIRGTCEICGIKKVDAHHDDYDKPLDVRWLCRQHHKEHHERNKHLTKEEYL